MNENGRIKLTDTLIDAIIKIVEGNPGATTVCAQLMKENERIDPDNIVGSMGPILSLDVYEIYGPRIWMFYKDFCEHNIVHMAAIMRAVQLGILSKAKMDHAIDNCGEGVDIKETLKAVQKRLSNFAHEENEN